MRSLRSNRARWRGPIKSGYGFHLVLVTQRTPTAPKPFEAVKDAVLAEWRGDRQTELSRDYLVELRKKYGVELDDSAKAVLGRSPQRMWLQNEARRPNDPCSSGCPRRDGVRSAGRAGSGHCHAGPAVASAHEVRPAYLSVQEEAPNEFSVLFKTPMQGDARLALSALFSGKIETVTPVVSHPTGDAMVQTWRMRTLEPLAGQNVLIDGLAEHHDRRAGPCRVRQRQQLDGAADAERAVGGDPGIAERLGRVRSPMSVTASSTSPSASTTCSSSPR